jgi:hypothetical protein
MNILREAHCPQAREIQFHFFAIYCAKNYVPYKPQVSKRYISKKTDVFMKGIRNKKGSEKRYLLSKISYQAVY